MLYIFDGGSIASRDPGLDLWLARVGEHHNTPEYSGFAAESNTVMCVPVDMNFLSACLPAMVSLIDLGRFVICAAPTGSFGLLHPKLNFENSATVNIGVNDLVQVLVMCSNNKG